jgi:glycosyltransferase involved in cell wall biosynthesis
VSCVLATRDRPRFLDIALRCYRSQTYRERELLVVDDGARYPADRERIEAAGGRLLRVEPDTPLGTKLNVAIGETRGALCQKVDDDDWYAPRFLDTMVGMLDHGRSVVCRPTIAFVTPFLLFETGRWDLRVSRPRNIPGATLLFSRDDWEAVPFRAVRSHEDLWFLMDQRRRGIEFLPVDALEQFVAIRHRADAGERGHTWTHNPDGERMESEMMRLPKHSRAPEAVLPHWARSFYRHLYLNAQARTG